MQSTDSIHDEQPSKEQDARDTVSSMRGGDKAIAGCLRAHLLPVLCDLDTRAEGRSLTAWNARSCLEYSCVASQLHVQVRSRASQRQAARTSVSLNICRRSLSTMMQSGACSTPGSRSGHLQPCKQQQQQQQNPTEQKPGCVLKRGDLVVWYHYMPMPSGAEAACDMLHNMRSIPRAPAAAPELLTMP